MSRFIVTLATTAVLSVSTLASAQTYTYTLDMKNELNLPMTVMDGGKNIGTVEINQKKSFAVTNEGNTLYVLVNGHDYCRPTGVPYNPFDFTMPLQFGMTNFHGTLSGHVIPGNTVVNCSVV